MKSIYLRNFITTAVLVLSCVIAVSLSFFFLGRSYLLNYARSSMTASANEAVHTAAAMSREQSLSSWGLRITLSTIANSTSSHVFICDHEGLVLSCSDPVSACSHLGRQLDSDIIDKVKTNRGLDEIGSLDGFYKTNRIIIAKPIISQNGVLGYVFVTSEDASIMSVWKALAGVSVAVTVVVLMVALIMSWVSSKKLAEPLDELTVAAGKFALGDFSVRVRNNGRDDEIGSLLDSFNLMADSLEKSEQNRQEFIANVSHELRTPMTTIAGFADGILDGTIPREQEKKYLHKIADETRRLSRLVRNMLDLSRAESLAVDKTKRTAFDLPELLLQTLLSFESRAKAKELDVDPQLPEDPIEVFAVRDSITQVLYNLTDNAVKFAAPNSTIRIRVYKRSGKAYVSITNSGSTIPQEDLPFIFDRFHKSDRSRSMDKDGVGLGLFLVKKIINGHDENIAVNSHDGMTEFVFTLPLAPTGK